MVGRLVAFQDADLNVVEAVAVIQIDQAAAGFLNRIGIDRAADFKISFLGELLGAQAVVAQVFDVADDRPLDDFENNNRPPGACSYVGCTSTNQPRPASLRISRCTSAGSKGRPMRV